MHTNATEDDPLLKPQAHTTSNTTNTLASSRWVTVEPVIIIMAAAAIPIYTIIEPKFIEDRVAKNLNYSLVDDNSINGTCTEQNNSDPDYLLRQQVADETAHWLMISTAISYIPALFVAPFYGALSDRVGRKINLLIPIVSNFANYILKLVVLYFNLSIAWFASSSVLAGCGGGYAFFMAGCYAYIADVTSRRSRLLRMSVVLAISNVAAGVVPLLHGYLIDLYGSDAYIPIIWSAIALQVVAILYIFLYLIEPQKQTSKSVFTLDFVVTTLHDVHALFKENVHDRRIRLSLLLVIFLLTNLVQLSAGASQVFTIYGLGPPFCWSATTVGYFLLTYLVCGALGMLIGGKLFSLCLQEYWILQIAYTFGMIQYVIAAIAPSTAIFFLSVVIGGLRAMDGPVIYSILAGLVSPGEHGVVFAVESSVQSVANFITPFIWNPIYSATLNTRPSLVFFAMGGVYVIMILMSWIWFTWSNRVLTEAIEGRGDNHDELTERSQETLG